MIDSNQASGKYVFRFPGLCLQIKRQPGPHIVKVYGYAAAALGHGSCCEGLECEIAWMEMNEFTFQMLILRTSLVVRQLSLPVNVEDTGLIPGLEDSTCHAAAKPMSHNYSAHTLEPASFNN